jgi:molecular chaperone GrpE
MAKTNGRPEVKKTNLDLEHELPAGDAGENSAQTVGAESSIADSELQKIKAERDSLLDRLARMQALLPVLDSFERALQVKSDAAEFRNGVDLIYKQLQTALGKVSLQSIVAKGEPFDPRYHEAIEMVDTTEIPDHQVIEELQRGYKLKDRLLRPAMVKVARNPGK